jgi:hypothetical protein
VIIRIKRGTSTQVAGTTLQTGEFALATDTNELFIQGNSNLIVLNRSLPTYPSFKPRPPGINDYVVPYAVNATAGTTLALTSSRTYWIPFTASRSMSIATMAINVTTASSGTHYIGIYATNNTWQPTGNPLINTSFSTGATGVVTYNANNLALGIGAYWLAWAAGSAATVRAIALAACPPLALPSLGTASTTYYYTSGNTLPSPAPTSGFSSATGSALPAVGFLFSYT